jgi:hypothetical protein
MDASGFSSGPFCLKQEKWGAQKLVLEWELVQLLSFCFCALGKQSTTIEKSV